MNDKNDNHSEKPVEEDSLVDALESIKGLLAKSDSKLTAAHENLATASSSHSQFNKLNKNKTEQIEIPVLDEIISPGENDTAEPVATASLASGTEAADDIPTLYSTIESPGPEILLNYLDNLQHTLEQRLSESLRSSIDSIEAQLKASLAQEIDVIREQIKKDFS